MVCEILGFAQDDRGGGCKALSTGLAEGRRYSVPPPGDLQPAAPSYPNEASPYVGSTWIQIPPRLNVSDLPEAS